MPGGRHPQRHRLLGQTRADRIRVSMVGTVWRATDATAVAVTVTATQAQAAGFLTAWPAGQPLPNASTVNYGAFEDRANGAIVKLGTDGAIDVRASAPTQHHRRRQRLVPPGDERERGSLRADHGPARVRQPSAEFARPLAARRDDHRRATRGRAGRRHRAGDQRHHHGAQRSRGSSPPSPPARRGRRRRCSTPTGPARPAPRRASRRSRRAGSSVYSHSGGHVIIDVTGWFTGPSRRRIRPTACSSPPTRRSAWSTPAPAIRCGRRARSRSPVPVTGASSIVVNTTLVDAHAWGFLTAYAARTAVPETSTVNAGARHQTAANLAIVPDLAVGDRRSAPSAAPTSSSTSPAGSSGARWRRPPARRRRTCARRCASPTRARPR